MTGNSLHFLEKDLKNQPEGRPCEMCGRQLNTHMWIVVNNKGIVTFCNVYDDRLAHDNDH